MDKQGRDNSGISGNFGRKIGCEGYVNIGLTKIAAEDIEAACRWMEAQIVFFRAQSAKLHEARG